MLVSTAGVDPIRCSFNSDGRKKQLQQLRSGIKDHLESIDCPDSTKENTLMNELDYRETFIQQTAQVKDLCNASSSAIKDFIARIIKECILVLGEPPCAYEVIVLGSLARNEMTPYSDFEWAILVSSDEEECKVFFRNLTNLVHLQVFSDN